MSMNTHAVQIKMTYTSIPVSGTNIQPLQAYQAQPTIDERLPAVLVIHEIYGLNDSIRNLTHNLAQVGFLTLAVDLFSGSGRLVRRAQALAGMAKRQLHHGIQNDLQSALDYLHHHSDTHPDKLGVIGFGMGGSYALHFACQDSRLKAAAIYFTLQPKDLQITPKTCPILGSYPETDFTTQDAHQLRAALQANAVPHEIKFYTQTLHSFTNEYTAAYNQAASEDAWNRLLAFLGNHLKTNQEINA